MTFDSLDALFSHLSARGGANPQEHGQLGQFYVAMSSYKNPNTCGCRKGPKALANIVSIASSMSSLSGNASVKALFDNNEVVVNHNGATIARF